MKSKYEKKLLLAGILLLIPVFLFAQPPKKSRILFLLDASSSMTLPWNGGYSRFDVASNILLKIIDSVYAVNNEIEFAVRAYGTIYPAREKNCTDTKLEVPFNIQNVNQIKTRLKNISPIGFSPIAYSLKQAAENELGDALLYDYSIIFITDGGESCKGDVCNTFKEFLAKKIRVKPYIIGLDKNEQLDILYNCMGSFINVKDSTDIDIAVKMIVDANRLLLDKPKLLNLPTTYANPPVIKDFNPPPPSLPVTNPVRSGNPFPRLNIIPYKVKNNGTYVMQPVYMILKKPDVVTIRMDLTEKVAPVARVQDVFPRMAGIKYIGLKNISPVLTGKEYVVKKGKAILKFDMEEPVVKVTNVMPRLYNTMPVYLPVAGRPKLTASLNKSIYPRATLRFDMEEPVKRTTDVMPRLTAPVVGFKTTTAKTVMVSKPFVMSRNEKAVLRFEIEEPLKRVTNVMPSLLLPGYAYKKTSDATPLTAKVFTLKKEKAVLRFEIEEKPKPALVTITPEKYPMRYSYAYRLPSLNQSRPARGRAILRFGVNELGVVQKKDTVLKKVNPPPNGNNSEFTVDVIPSEETRVQIFFLGRDGKRYPTATPEIQFSDFNTKQQVTSFHRQVSGGDPIPQKINPGKYNIVVAGYNALYLMGVTIEPNKLNKVTIKVTEGTLSFAYIGNRNKPIEYSAIVNRRFAAGATILQRCTDRLPYEPGTYYVEINTMPASKFSIDMSFGALYELQIPEPGLLQVTNTEPVGRVQLQCMIGDQFLVFHTMNMDGNAGSQQLKMQPGFYKAIFAADTRMPQMGTKTVDFQIKSNQNTLLELR